MPIYGKDGEVREKTVGKVNSDGLPSRFWPAKPVKMVMSRS